jgi:hypothetical protein
MIDAIVGRYRLRIEDTGVVLTHPSGISFDLTADEALGMYEFVGVYRKTLLEDDRETEPVLKRVVIEEPEQEA